ncbi:MAG: hypothetical protein ACK5RG_01655 [Cyclobacteriaceae bacterium]|nr:hypothetical protein [Flammeovirgaceae bacterium]
MIFQESDANVTDFYFIANSMFYGSVSVRKLILQNYLFLNAYLCGMGKKDVNQLAKFISAQAIGDTPKQAKKKEGQQLGGLKGGAGRAKSLTAKQRSEIAKKAAKKRWDK